MAFCDDDIVGRETPQQAAEAALQSAWNLAVNAISADIVNRASEQEVHYSFHPDKETFAASHAKDSAWQEWLLKSGASPAKAYAVLEQAVKAASAEVIKTNRYRAKDQKLSDGTVFYALAPRYTTALTAG